MIADLVAEKKAKAHKYIHDAILAGVIERAKFCSRCGVKGDIEAHHRDYDRPADVIWLCGKCHKEEHHDDIIATYQDMHKGPDIIYQCLCTRCSKKWWPRVLSPKRCPYCGSPYWWKEREK